MSKLSIQSHRLLARINQLGEIGRDEDNRLIRLAASDNEKLGRDRFVAWLNEAELDVKIDRIGNIFGIWCPEGTSSDLAPIMIGSHIDTVINAGIYDGCYGVLAGLEVIQSLKEQGLTPQRPLVIAAFTNEEGVRFAPNMLGSLVYAGGLNVETALTTIGIDGAKLGDELERIGYAGKEEPGFITPHAYIELHIEQGPVLEKEKVAIGAVENLQGISWQKITISGEANHAGTTPISMRKDAGLAAAQVITFLRERAKSSNTPTVATVGRMSFEPNAINIVPSRVIFTVDIRNPHEYRLKQEEEALAEHLELLKAEEQIDITVERLARSEPVTFDPEIVQLIETTAKDRGFTTRRITSGAGHDAQMIARIAPAAMIFVPSIAGISHNPREFTPDSDLIAGANVLLGVVTKILSSWLTLNIK